MNLGPIGYMVCFWTRRHPAQQTCWMHSDGRDTGGLIIRDLKPKDPKGAQRCSTPAASRHRRPLVIPSRFTTRVDDAGRSWTMECPCRVWHTCLAVSPRCTVLTPLSFLQRVFLFVCGGCVLSVGGVFFHDFSRHTPGDLALRWFYFSKKMLFRDFPGIAWSVWRSANVEGHLSPLDCSDCSHSFHRAGLYCSSCFLV